MASSSDKMDARILAMQGGAGDSGAAGTSASQPYVVGGYGNYSPRASQNKITARKRGDYSDTGVFSGGVPIRGAHYENGRKK